LGGILFAQGIEGPRERCRGWPGGWMGHSSLLGVVSLNLP
jgi:hypothetical protein